MDLKYVPTTCCYCGCGCGLYLKVAGERIIGAIPALNHPVSQGRLCVKGLNCWEIVDHPDRLRLPMVKKDGRLVEADWDEALDLIARKLLELKTQHGPQALGMWGSARSTNETNYLAMKFARTVIGTNNVDHSARHCQAPTIAGLGRAFGLGAMTNSIDELRNAQVLFIIGSNPTEAHPLVGYRVREAKDRGAKLVVADPRRTDVARWADLHLQHYPGTDITLLNALMNVIIAEELQDKPYIENRLDGFDELRAAVEKYTPDYAAPICGVEPSLIRDAARLLASAKPMATLYTLGITEHTTGTDNVLSVANLAMITGNVGIESGGVNPLAGRNNGQGACDMGMLPDFFPGYQSVTDEKTRQKFEKAWGAELPKEAGLTATDQMIQAREGKIKALYIIGEDPLSSSPNLDHARQAFESLEFLVVHELFMTPTAEQADVLLPVASFAEEEGTYTNTERRVQRVRAAVDPIPEAISSRDILVEVAQRMGGESWEHRDPAEIWKELVSLSPLFAGIKYGRLEEGGLQWPCPKAAHPGTVFLHKDEFTRGRGQLHGLADRPPAEVPDEEYPFILTTGRMRFHDTVGTMSRRTTLLRREFPRMFVQLHPEDAERLGLAPGEAATVSTRRGALTVDVQITDRIKKGVLWMPFHFAETPANRLTLDAFCPVSRTGEYKACAAKVEKGGSG